MSICFNLYSVCLLFKFPDIVLPRPNFTFLEVIYPFDMLELEIKKKYIIYVILQIFTKKYQINFIFINSFTRIMYFFIKCNLQNYQNDRKLKFLMSFLSLSAIVVKKSSFKLIIIPVKLSVLFRLIDSVMTLSTQIPVIL